ncbi:hypothetical protein ACH5RR_005757 [Cinchona calisaya]|uniref:Stress induced protein n=1 Tax=Cinchona calisaya TaxID=153742 RepID=A0ABD3AMC1_9GENT
MARAQEKQAFTTSTYSPIREQNQEDHLDFDEIATPSGCCCCFGWIKNNHESKYLLQENNGLEQQHKESWFVNKLKKLKEFSEVAAGPKWKNLVRKIGKYLKPDNKQSRTYQSMYTPNSYALNFDDGGEEEEDDDLFVSFSSRFSAPLSSNQQKTEGSSS